MTEDEKNEIDEWLEDVDDGGDGELDQLNIDALLSGADLDDDDDDEAELDQSNIDALFDNLPDSEAAAEEDNSELDQSNIDALLGGADSSEDDGDDEPPELDQDNIDALFDSADTPAEAADSGDDLAELDQDNIDALFEGADSEPEKTDEAPAELDQDNIDALFAEDAGDTEEPEDLAGGELDQDNIDALFAGADDSPAQEEAPADDGGAELDQDNIDALFAEDAAAAPAAEATEEAAVASAPASDDDNIDALFDDIDAASSEASPEEDNSLDALFSDDEEDGTQLAEAGDGDENDAFDSEFDEMDQLFSELEDDGGDEEDPFESEDEIDFAEMLSDDDDDGDDFLELSAEQDEESFDDSLEETSAVPGEQTTGLEEMMAEDGSQSAEEEKDKKPALPAFLADMSKTALASIGGGAVLLLLLGLFFLLKGGGDDGEQTTVAQVDQTQQQQGSQQPAPASNFIPVVADSSYSMAPQGGEVVITLKGEDQDGQPLNYTITNQPQHGRLSGTAPNLVYLPNSNFPGQDRFEYQANDGQDSSALAAVTISGPDLGALAALRHQQEVEAAAKRLARQKKVFKPAKPRVLAHNATYHTTSTAPVVLDWQRLWQEANKSSFSPETHVEIIANRGRGHLTMLDDRRHSYTPDPYSASVDVISYRFKRGGFRSEVRDITVNVELGSPAPEINFAELEERYAVGQKVVLDASPSRDEQRQALHFSWRQTGGVPVTLSSLNNEGSKVAFVMPSSFYTGKNYGPSFLVTAEDASGQVSSREITVQATSRRQTALWRGDLSSGGMRDNPEMSGRYMPWPYAD